MIDLKICTYNVRGLRQNRKRRTIFTYLHSFKHDIYLLQETHSDINSEKYWANEWGGKVICSHGTTSSRGVAILFNPCFDVSILSLKSDVRGRYTFLMYQEK